MPASQDSRLLDNSLRDRRVIVALTGGIACYKSADLVSRLAQSGASVRVLMTKAATRFVAPLTFQSLSNGPVVTSVWDVEDNYDSPHIALARWCELMVIAPASADAIAKIAAGICEDVVCLVAAAIGKTKPIVLAPAMNADMWANPITGRNVAAVKDTLGYTIVGPDSGWQACRTTGPGRMAAPEAIYDTTVELLNQNKP